MDIRIASMDELPRIMEIYARARAFMAAHGNPRQWGGANWPPEALIRSDIEQGKCYVCTEGGALAAVFYYDYGRDIEPTYRKIFDGAWIGDESYGVVHRIAASGLRKGAGAYCLEWAYARHGHLRIDTHGDNTVMQGLLRKLGFSYCGVIYVEVDDDPRLAFEKVAVLDDGKAGKSAVQSNI